MLRKTTGLVDVLRGALQTVVEEIDFAFVYGSMASGTEHAHSDVDVMIVGKLDFAHAIQALAPAQEQLRREINPTILTAKQFASKSQEKDGFVAQVLNKPRLWVLGSEGEMT